MKLPSNCVVLVRHPATSAHHTAGADADVGVSALGNLECAKLQQQMNQSLVLCDFIKEALLKLPSNWYLYGTCMSLCHQRSSLCTV